MSGEQHSSDGWVRGPALEIIASLGAWSVGDEVLVDLDAWSEHIRLTSVNSQGGHKIGLIEKVRDGSPLIRFYPNDRAWASAYLHVVAWRRP